MGYRSFVDLEVWKRACRVAARVYEALKNCRDFGLRDQMTRAAVSIPSNIAEGAERNSQAEYTVYTPVFGFVGLQSDNAGFIRYWKPKTHVRRVYKHFLHIAKGSAAELRTQLYIAERVGIVDQTTQTELTNELKQISAMLQGLSQALNS